MSEQLLTPTEVYRKLRISRARFYRVRAKLISNGMQTIKVDGTVKYVESSIDVMIQRCASEGVALC